MCITTRYLLQLCRELILVKKGIVIPCYDPKVTVDEGNDRMYIRPEGVDPKVVWENMISGCNQELLNKYDNSYLMLSHIYTGYMYMYVLLIMIYWMYDHQHINFLFYLNVFFISCYRIMILLIEKYEIHINHGREQSLDYFRTFSQIDCNLYIMYIVYINMKSSFI